MHKYKGIVFTDDDEDYETGGVDDMDECMQVVYRVVVDMEWGPHRAEGKRGWKAVTEYHPDYDAPPTADSQAADAEANNKGREAYIIASLYAMVTPVPSAVQPANREFIEEE